MTYQSDYSTRTVTAFFDDRSTADQGVEDLVDAGFPRDSIRVVGGTASGTATTTTTTRSHEGFWASLKDFFLPEEDRYAYAEGLSRGGYLLTLTTSDAAYERAVEILDRVGTVDLAERESAWRAEGWSGYQGSSDYQGSSTLDRGIAGPILSASSYFMKSPPIQYSDDEARDYVEKFIRGEVER